MAMLAHTFLSSPKQYPQKHPKQHLSRTVKFTKFICLLVFSCVSSAYADTRVQLPNNITADKQQIQNTSHLKATADTASTTPKHTPQYKQQQEATLFKKIAALNLANDPTWLKMIYMSEYDKSSNSYKKRPHSEIKQDHFFLSSKGKTDSLAEMQATISGLLNPVAEKNKSVTCRFPARRYWLEQQLKLEKNTFPTANCPEFDEWFSAINPHKIALIFASDYLNNPSSMFGHTLLRVDQEKGSDLLAYAINYAAETAQGTGLAYAVKGLTGGYNANFSIMPYYEKVKSYGDLESRDIWEYSLKLSPRQSKQLVRYVWELRGVEFPYYFLGDNCSYKILRLIDIVKPELNSQSWFINETIPAQTIKAFENNSEMFTKVTYRPSFETQLKAQWFLHGDNNANTAHQLALGNLPLALAPNQANDSATPTKQHYAQQLEMAYDNLYLLYLKRKGDQPSQKKRLRQLLSARSKLNTPKQRPKRIQSINNPALGHDAKRMRVGLGYDADMYALFGYRLAYHDIVDSHLGYRQGMSIKGLDITAKLYQDKVSLDHVTLIGIKSFSPFTPFQQPASWGVSGGITRTSTTNKLVGYVDYELGYAFSFGNNKGMKRLNDKKARGIKLQDLPSICYAQGTVDVQAGETLDYGWRGALGVQAGCLIHANNKLRTHANVKIPYWYSTDFHTHDDRQELLYGFTPSVALTSQYDFNKNNALRLKITHDYHRLHTDNPVDVSISWLNYF